MARLSGTVRQTVIQGDSVQGGVQAQASLTTSLTGTNNDLVYTAKSTENSAYLGANGNAIRVVYVVSGTSTPLSVSVSGTDITVNVATNGGGAATSTAAQISAAVLAHATAKTLVDVSNAAGNDGTGVVTAMSITALSGGTSYVTGRGSGAVRRTGPYGLRNN